MVLYFLKQIKKTTKLKLKILYDPKRWSWDLKNEESKIKQ
jgi:hypothetical protein